MTGECNVMLFECSVIFELFQFSRSESSFLFTWSSCCFEEERKTREEVRKSQEYHPDPPTHTQRVTEGGGEEEAMVEVEKASN